MDIPASFITTVCPNCAYSLAGSDAVGTCPECGRAYNQSELILYGWARGKHENVGNANPKRIVPLLCLSIFLLVFRVILYVRDRATACVIAGISVAPVLFFFARRKNNSHPGSIQVRLSAQGCVQYNDLAGPSLVLELLRSYGWIIPIAFAAYLIVAWHAGDLNPILFWLFLPLVLVGAVVTWRSCRRFRGALRQLRDGSIAEFSAALAKPAVWSDIRDFTLETAGKGNYRLQVCSFEWFGRNDVVDAEIHCTQEQAKALKLWIDQRISEARKA